MPRPRLRARGCRRAGGLLRYRPTARHSRLTKGRCATFLPSSTALDRAALFAALGDEAAATDDNTAAAGVPDSP
jgi:hypothetical protein